jgi:hypothetical protein
VINLEVAGKRPTERVLTRAGTDDQHLHLTPHFTRVEHPPTRTRVR